MAFPSGALPLRPYQHDAKGAFTSSPHQRALMAMACGLGKTVIFPHIIAELASAASALWCSGARPRGTRLRRGADVLRR